jgi:hypothetical protein
VTANRSLSNLDGVKRLAKDLLSPVNILVVVLLVVGLHVTEVRAHLILQNQSELRISSWQTWA